MWLVYKDLNLREEQNRILHLDDFLESSNKSSPAAFSGTTNKTFGYICHIH